MSKLQPVRGTHDFLGDDMARFNRVTVAFADVARRFGFQQASVPIFEMTEVFARSIGETTDVVAKEMYSFEDRGGDSITLRPEFTAGLARAYLSNGWQQFAPLKLYAHGPAFRYERPQKGRYRQFHQIDAEIIGAPEAQADIELIAMGQLLLEELGIAGAITLTLNTLGDGPSRAKWRDALVAYFSKYQDILSKDSLARLEKNPLRILDSKDEADRRVVADAPLLDQYLSSEAGHFFESVCKGLDVVGVCYTRDAKLVRGLDYYCHTAWEFVTAQLGAQGTVLGGGRYDGLMEQLGGPATAGVGWAAGIERLSMLLAPPAAARGPVAVIPVGETAEKVALGIAQTLRRAGFAVEQGLRGNMKKRLSRAVQQQSPVAIILGETEIASGVAAVKDLATGMQQQIAIADLVTSLGIYK
jgi:histidyl-tRNA synthetase